MGRAARCVFRAPPCTLMPSFPKAPSYPIHTPCYPPSMTQPPWNATAPRSNLVRDSLPSGSSRPIGNSHADVQRDSQNLPQYSHWAPDKRNSTHYQETHSPQSTKSSAQSMCHNSLLVTLNSRNIIRDINRGTGASSFSLVGTAFSQMVANAIRSTEFHTFP